MIIPLVFAQSLYEISGPFPLGERPSDLEHSVTSMTSLQTRVTTRICKPSVSSARSNSVCAVEHAPRFTPSLLEIRPVVEVSRQVRAFVLSAFFFLFLYFLLIPLTIFARVVVVERDRSRLELFTLKKIHLARRTTELSTMSNRGARSANDARSGNAQEYRRTEKAVHSFLVLVGHLSRIPDFCRGSVTYTSPSTRLLGENRASSS